MARITVYLEDDTAEKLRSVAGSSGVSVSSLVAKLIRNELACEWPASITRLGGAWKDFPSLDEVRQGQPDDAPRDLL